jgi:glycogen(starch) synthase
VIATAGRFSDYSKGADLVYRAFARLWRRRQDVFLLSIANKDRFAYLLADLPEHAWALVDWLPRRRFLSVLAACDLLVVPSRYEPFGLIALEAQALGVPVVANAVGGLAEIVHHGETGLLNPLADGSLGLSLAIERLAADPERLRRMRGPAREHARREYDFERVDALIERCLRRAELPGSLERSAGAVRSGAGEAAAAVFGGVN